jgi:hypothetical protein
MRKAGVVPEVSKQLEVKADKSSKEDDRQSRIYNTTRFKAE